MWKNIDWSIDPSLSQIDTFCHYAFHSFTFLLSLVGHHSNGQTVSHQIKAFMNHQFEYHWKLTLNDRGIVTKSLLILYIKIQYPWCLTKILKWKIKYINQFFLRIFCSYFVAIYRENCAIRRINEIEKNSIIWLVQDIKKIGLCKSPKPRERASESGKDRKKKWNGFT